MIYIERELVEDFLYILCYVFELKFYY